MINGEYLSCAKFEIISSEIIQGAREFNPMQFNQLYNLCCKKNEIHINDFSQNAFISADNREYQKKIFYNSALLHYNKTICKKFLQDIPINCFAVSFFDNSSGYYNA